MKKKVMFFVMLVFFSLISTKKYGEAKEFNIFPQYRLFHMYVEYTTGELSNPYGERIFEQLDTQMAYTQNIPNLEWLSLGLIGRITWDGLTRNAITQGNGALLPTAAKLTATVGFLNNIFIIGGRSDGVIQTVILYNHTLPKVPGLYSHDVEFYLSSEFFAPGNLYNKNDILYKGWFDKLEVRFIYRMKFNEYIGLRPVLMFNLMGADLIAGRGFKSSLAIRFNPRLQLYLGNFTYYIEPRVWWVGSEAFRSQLNAPDGFFWDIKVGFNILLFDLL